MASKSRFWYRCPEALFGAAVLFAADYAATRIFPQYLPASFHQFIIAAIAIITVAAIVLWIWLPRDAVPVCCAQCGAELTGRRASSFPNCGSPASMAFAATLRKCWHCGYILRGAESGKCPECGTPVKSERTADSGHA